MMLRSSSTPILSSLLSSCSESPNHNHHSEFNSPKHLPKKLSLHQTGLHLTSRSPYHFTSSPSVNVEFTPENSGGHGFRRVQSEGNLAGLASASCDTFDEFQNSIPTKKFACKPHCSVLESIPSFCVHGTGDEDDEEEEEGEEFGVVDKVKVESEYLSLDEGMAYISKGLQGNNLFGELECENIPSKMHLAKGLGAISTGGFDGRGPGGRGGHNEYKPVGFEGGEGGGAAMEEFYKRMMEENPGNPLFLRNYAQFLHQSKKDLKGAEEYYSRAILVDPGDGNILSKYAQVTWELHHDEERASSYFQRAVEAAPQDSHVIAAYAGFLWETEDDDDNMSIATSCLHQNSTIAAARA